MKTVIVYGKKYKQLPEVDSGNCTGCDLMETDVNCYDTGLSSVCNKGKAILKEIPKKPKIKKVSFYRYHRPVDHKTGYAKSDQGVTFFVKINYKKRTMRVSCSVCNGDNFSKVSGKFVASLRYDEKRYLEFPLDDYVSSQESVLDYLRLNLDDECHLPEFEAAVKQLRRMYAK